MICSRIVFGLLLAASAMPAWAVDLPSAVLAPPQPLRFGAEQAQVDLRVDLAHGPAALERVDHKLTLSAPLPMDATVLRARDIVIAPATTDAGERLGLLLKPASRDQAFAADHAFNRDRVVRLVLDLTPPWRPCARLVGVSGAVTLTLARGKARESTLPATKGASVEAEGVGRVELAEAGPKQLALSAPLALAERFVGVVARDRDGKEVAAKAKEKGRADGVVSWTIDAKPEAIATIATLIVSWYPTLADERIAFTIDEIQVPGGIPGLAGLAVGPGQPAPAQPKPATLKSPLQRAIVAGDRAEIDRQLAAATDIEAAEGDGRAPLARAAAAGDAVTLRALLARHAALAAAGRDGWTALHCAVGSGDLASVEALLAAGADPGAQAKDGRSCLDLARDLGRWRILSRLLGNAFPPDPVPTQPTEKK